MKKRGSLKILVIMLLTAMPLQFSFAATLQEINQQIEQNKAAAQNTQSDINSYDSALKRISNSIQTTQNKITHTNNQIGSTEQKISDLSVQIDQKNKELAELKSKIDKLIIEIYRFSNRSDLDLLLSSRNLGENSNEDNYIQAVQIQVHGLYGQAMSIKQDLEKNKKDSEDQKFNLEQLKANQTGYLTSLDQQTTVNNNLKSKAQGSLENYQTTIKKLQAQKAALEAAQRGIRRGGSMIGGSDLVTGSASWYYSQDNSAWSGNNIGNSDSTIGRYGCALTSLAMVLKYYGVNITPADIASNPAYFSDDLIVWPTIGGHSLHGGGGWSDVDESISHGQPVITKLNAFGGTHFVVIYSKNSEGKYLILDPISGSRTYGKSLVAQFYFYY